MNWFELETYFTAAERGESLPDRKYKARIIREMLHDSSNYLYVVFATPIVQGFEKVNATFQQTSADPHALHQELMMFYKFA